MTGRNAQTEDMPSRQRRLPRCCVRRTALNLRRQPTRRPGTNRCRRCPQSRPAADGTKPDDREKVTG